MTDLSGSAREAALARTFVVLADTLVDDFDVADMFDRLAGSCIELLGAATAGLMLADQHGRLQLMASSSEGMRALELLEMSHNEGPCMDCFATREAVSADLQDPASASRWPRFADAALAQSIAFVMALPMRLRGETIGALNVFHGHEYAMSDHDRSLAQALADVATIALLQRRALASSELLIMQLQEALNDRIVIEQVKGLLAERGDIGVDAAFGLLREYCRSSRIPLTRTARELLDGHRDPDDVLAGRWPPTPRL